MVIVSVPDTRGRGFLKFKRKLSAILAEYKEREKKLEQKL